MRQTAVDRVNHEVIELSEIGRGVRQSCLISPLLYGLDENVKINGEYAKAVRYADD